MNVSNNTISELVGRMFYYTLFMTKVRVRIAVSMWKKTSILPLYAFDRFGKA
jgi:hypothetical protein